jgi:LCP family protein required for cell wall assembly
MKENDYNKDDNNTPNRIEIASFVNKGSEISQLSGKLKKRADDVDDSYSFVREVNSSLAKQVQYDMDEEKRNKPKPSNKKKKKKGKRVLKAVIYSLLILAVLGCVLMYTPIGKKIVAKIATEYIYGNLNYKESPKQNAKEDTVKAPTDTIVNILLVGVEEIGNARNTDSMIIATMNTKTHSLKMTSLMRDIYVDIEGHNKNKLNSAFAQGGIDLLYDTVQKNFGIKIDGYCMVNFNQFQDIVDLVHGVKVNLTENEAYYLNHTNYISKKKYRTVKAGENLLNGNQALGYCRVRKRSTATESNDFGRTQRQRIVLKAIYSKVKSMNPVEQVLIMNKILGQVKVDTDITKDEFSRYLEEAIDLNVKNLETLRVPTDGSYDNAKVPMGRYNVEVLVPKDWNALREQIYDFIYKDTKGTQTEADDATASGKELAK